MKWIEFFSPLGVFILGVLLLSLGYLLSQGSVILLEDLSIKAQTESIELMGVVFILMGVLMWVIAFLVRIFK